MNLYIGLYGCHGVIRFDVKFWEIKIRQNFKFFTVTWLTLIGKGRRAQKRSGNESKAHPARVQEGITSVTTPHLDGVSVHGKHDFKFVWHFAGTYLYSWLWRSTLSTVSYLRTQHSDPDRFRTQTSRLTIQCINRPTIITPGENGMGPLITLCSPKTGQGDESRSLSRASISGRHQKEESTLFCDMPRDQRVKGDKVKLTPFLFPWTWANLGRTRVCMPPSLLRLPNFSWDCTKITPLPQQYFGHLFLNALDLWPPREKGCIKAHWSQQNLNWRMR